MKKKLTLLLLLLCIQSTFAAVSVKVCGPDEKHVLNEGDLIYIAPGEERDMIINGGKPAEVLVTIVTP